MYIYWIVMTLLIVAGGFSTQLQYANETVADKTTVDTLGRSMLIYRSAASEYAHAHPGFVGVPASSSLALPNWYIVRSEIATYITGGVSYTYIIGPFPPGLAAALAELTESATVGVKRAGRLYSPQGGTLAIPIPGPVPEGSVVAVF